MCKLIVSGILEAVDSDSEVVLYPQERRLQ